jgi:prepilin-type N-terminal cleavage/methylation domain-containing protein
MKKVNKKPVVKGMTLIEIIISMVVFAVLALILAQVGTTINNVHKNSIMVSKRTTIEKPFAVNGYKSADTDNIDLKDDNMKVTVKFDGRDVDIKGQCYVTKTDKADTISNADLQYVDINLEKVLKYKKTSDGFYELKDSTGKTIYKKDGKYYKADKTTEIPADEVDVDDVISVIEDSNLWTAPEGDDSDGDT